MIYQYGDHVDPDFFQEPASLIVEGRTIRYVGFCRSEHRHQTPLVLLGGAFQDFASFAQDVKAYLPEMPVLLVALPGHASNGDLQGRDALSLRAMADLLEAFFQELQLEHVALAGFADASLLAYTYAYTYEMRLTQLILVGCSLELRHTQKQILQHAVETARRPHIQHLLDERLPPRNFQVRTLVLTALFDHFTSADQSLEVHGCFENGDFVLIEKGEQLLPLCRHQLVPQTIRAFLSDAPYEGEGVLYGDIAIARAGERRLQPRFKVKGLAVVLTHADAFRLEGILDDVSLDGCGLTLPALQGAAAEFDGTWQLEIGASDYKIPGFLRVNQGKGHFVFFKKDLSDRKHIHDFIEAFQDVALPLRMPAIQ